MQIKIDTSAIVHLEAALELMANKSIRYATKRALDATAWDARKNAQELISTDFINRNKWTAGSIRVTASRIGPIASMESAFGSTQEYMRTQEKGGIKKPSSGSKLPIPTSRAAGQGRGKKPRTKLVKRANKMAAIKLKQRAVMGLPVKQQWGAVVQFARRHGHRFAYLPRTGGRFGIHELRGNKVDLLWDLSQPSARIPKHRWMRPSADKTRRSNVTLEAYRKALSFQIHREIKGRYRL